LAQVAGQPRLQKLFRSFDNVKKTVVYCKASLMTELHDAGSKVGEENVPVVASICQKNFGLTLKFLTQDQKLVYTARLR